MKKPNGKIADAGDVREMNRIAQAEREYREAVLNEGPEYVPVDNDPPSVHSDSAEERAQANENFYPNQ